MTRFVKRFGLVMVLIMLVSVISMPTTAYAATAKGTIAALSNTATGIKVTWTKDSAKMGYYIYRKAGTAKSYQKVKQIKSASTTSWTDPNVANGTRYMYKVCSYKGSKITQSSTAKTIYRLDRPTISSLSRAGGTSVKVQASNAKATGFQIRYSTKSDFSSYKSITVKGTKLNKTITGLAKNTKYYVKVRAYKTVSGTNYYSAFSASKNATTYYVNQATISSLSKASSTSICVKAADAKATGFQIRYSTKSDFSSYKSITVKGANLNKTIAGLTKGTKYFVKVRAYRTINGSTYYGAFSGVKSVVTYYTAYTKNVTTALYTKPTSSSDYKTVYYNQKVTLYDNEASYAKGEWRKVKYDGTMYYCWIDAGEQKFTTTPDRYDHYTNPDNAVYQQEVVDYAVSYMSKPTNYVKGGVGEKNDAGQYQFDCSGFVSHVLNKVMKQYNPVYLLSANINRLHDSRELYNQGFDTRFKATVVCEYTKAKPVDWAALQPGDVVFFNERSDTDKSTYTHCGIYLGDKQFIQSTKSTSGVSIMPMDSGIYYNRFVRAIRYLPDQVQPINQTATVTNQWGMAVYTELDTSFVKAGTDKEQLKAEGKCITIPAGEQMTVEYYNDMYGYSTLSDGTIVGQPWAAIQYDGQRYYAYKLFDKADLS
ncbi:MAG: fibronectin type III domain-containing protein [Clostridiales bacterium]|nr:fibronectin type III domain-containing protein [Candidatus Cacconaster stercorequi]